MVFMVMFVGQLAAHGVSDRDTLSRFVEAWVGSVPGVAEFSDEQLACICPGVGAGPLVCCSVYELSCAIISPSIGPKALVLPFVTLETCNCCMRAILLDRQRRMQQQCPLDGSIYRCLFCGIL